MKEKYAVTIHYEDDYGYIEYDEDAKTAVVKLVNEEKRQAVERFLQQQASILVAGDSLKDYMRKEVLPLENVDSLELALTQLWNVTQVFVDWSRPVEK